MYGSFTGATSDRVSGVTAADGTVTLSSSKARGGGTREFCVTDIVKDGYTYDASANAETCDTVETHG